MLALENRRKQYVLTCLKVLQPIKDDNFICRAVKQLFWPFGYFIVDKVIGRDQFLHCCITSMEEFYVKKKKTKSV